MAHQDDSFWLVIFRKYPLIATIMAICGVIGFGIGVLFILNLAQANRVGVPIRWAICFLFSTSCGGIFVGLVIGVIIDTIIGSARDSKKKKRFDKRGNRIEDWD
jgi:F0F1-type ATP synthase assembly protein I